MAKTFGGASNLAPHAKPAKAFKSSSKYDQDYEDWLNGKQKGKVGTGGYGRCYESHPPLKLPNTDLVIYGGSCINPSVKDADVYIGFDNGMERSKKSWPWVDGHSLLFPITDMCAPSNVADFKALIAWTLTQLKLGHKVHAGCIGGHGRTGTFFAALAATLGETDAITYVREHYCKKVVESTEQVNFLHDHFGVKKIGGSKSSSWGGGGGMSSTQKSTSGFIDDGPRSFAPLHTITSIWGFKGGKGA